MAFVTQRANSERHSIEAASPPGAWFRWNGRIALIVFLAGVAMLWLALALLYTLEIQ